MAKWTQHLQEFGNETYEEIEGRDCFISLEPRPTYCDRGNFLAKLFITDARKLFIDDADAWPRYYMNLERAKAEIEEWLQKRGQWK